MKIKTLCLVLSVMFSINSMAEIFNVKGFGHSIETAKQDAIKNAIIEGVGQLNIVSEELSNDKLSEHITTYSNAYVESASFQNIKEVSAGLYEIEAKIDIRSQKLLEKIQSDFTIAKGTVNIDKNKVEEIKNKDLVEQANAEMTLDEMYLLFKELYLNHISNRNTSIVNIIIDTPFEIATEEELKKIYKFRYAEGTIKSYMESEKIILSSNIYIEPNPVLVQNLKKFLEQISIPKRFISRYNKLYKVYEKNSLGNKVKTYYLPCKFDGYHKCRALFDREHNLNNRNLLDRIGEEIKFYVEALDENGNEIEIENFYLYTESDDLLFLRNGKVDIHWYSGANELKSYILDERYQNEEYFSQFYSEKQKAKIFVPIPKNSLEKIREFQLFIDF